MPDGWAERPRIDDAEQHLFMEFMRFHQACQGETKPSEARAWFDMRGVDPEHWGWMAQVFGAMSGVMAEKLEGGA